MPPETEPDAPVHGECAAEIERLNAVIFMREQRIQILENALITHRMDLHQGSPRPCTTCAQSAMALGLDVPKRCARHDFDMEAIQKRLASVKSPKGIT